MQQATDRLGQVSPGLGEPVKASLADVPSNDQARHPHQLEMVRQSGHIAFEYRLQISERMIRFVQQHERSKADGIGNWLEAVRKAANFGNGWTRWQHDFLEVLGVHDGFDYWQ
jgi:hypothetical protein